VVSIELLGDDAIDPLCDHLVRNALESGRDGDPLARARSADEPIDLPELRARVAAGWRVTVGEIGWERCFGLRLDGDVRGHLDLRGGTIASELHRARLGIGIERPWRRDGWGRRMMLRAIDWAREQGLAWIDLGVFAENQPARALYTSLGFTVAGRRDDRYRVDGRSIDELAMTLRL